MTHLITTIKLGKLWNKKLISLGSSVTGEENGQENMTSEDWSSQVSRDPNQVDPLQPNQSVDTTPQFSQEDRGIRATFIDPMSYYRESTPEEKKKDTSIGGAGDYGNFGITTERLFSSNQKLTNTDWDNINALIAGIGMSSSIPNPYTIAIGEVADAAGLIINIIRGDWMQVALFTLALVPMMGDAATTYARAMQSVAHPMTRAGNSSLIRKWISSKNFSERKKIVDSLSKVIDFLNDARNFQMRIPRLRKYIAEKLRDHMNLLELCSYYLKWAYSTATFQKLPEEKKEQGGYFLAADKMLQDAEGGIRLEIGKRLVALEQLVNDLKADLDNAAKGE